MTRPTTKTASCAIADPLDGLLAHALRRASVAVTAGLADALAPLGLTPGEASLLSIIAAYPGCTQSDIGRAMRAQPANLVPLVTRLVAAGHVDREPGEGRAIALRLTASGGDLAARAGAIVADREARIARHLTPEQAQALIATLRTVCKDACCDD